MESLELPTAAAAIGIALIFVLAGFVKGAIGLGLPTVAMGLLGLLMPPAQAASLLIAPSFVTNVWQLASGSRASGVKAPDWRVTRLGRRLASMMIGVCAGTWMMQALLASIAAQAAARTAAQAAARASNPAITQSLAAHATVTHAWATQSWATAALGLALTAYALIGLLARPWSVPRAREPWLSPLVGLSTGLVTGATGVFVMPAVPYLQALGLDKEELMQALGLSFTVSTIALAIGLAGDGTLDLAAARASSLALAPALAGMALGAWVRRRVSAERFRLAFLIALFALGLHLWWRAI